MKKKELQELSKKTKADLQKLLLENRDKLWQLRTDLANGKVKNVREIRATRKIIARLLTFISGQKA